MRMTTTRLQLQCCLLQQCSGVVHMGQGNCFLFFSSEEREGGGAGGGGGEQGEWEGD